MNQYVTGAVIRELREKNRLTQAQLAERLCVSDKAVSKWETGKGYPDISLLEPLAKEFHVSITELLSGNAVSNANVSANMLRSLFYVCPVCGNVIHCMGEARFRMDGVRSIYFYCNRDGLFFADPVKGIGCQEKHPFSSSANSSI